MRLIAALCWAGFALALSGCASAPWQPVGPGVWLAAGAVAQPDARNGGWTSNLGFVQAGAQGWLIGSGPSAALAGQLRQALWRDQGLPITHLLSPRPHPESVLGAAGLPGLPHHAVPEVTRAMALRCPACAARLAQRLAQPLPGQPGKPAVEPTRVNENFTSPIALPTLPVTAQRVGTPSWPTPQALADGPDRLHFLALERAPGEWTTAVLRGRTLLAPGLVWGAGLLPELREASLPALLAALHHLRALAPSVVVPEQGAPGDGGLIDKDLRYWQGLGALVCGALQSGHTLEEAQAQPSWAALVPGAVAATTTTAAGQSIGQLNKDRHALNTQRAWLEGESALLNAPGQHCPALSLAG